MTSPSSSCEKVDVEAEVDVEGNDDDDEEEASGSSNGVNSSPLDALFALTRKPFEDPKAAGKKDVSNSCIFATVSFLLLYPSHESE